MRGIARSFLAGLTLLVAACSGSDDGIVRVVLAGEGQDLTNSGLRLAPGAQLARAATASGLVTFDAGGEVIPGLADSWIVTDDGRSYIFRLRNARWPDGTAIDGRTAAASLRRAISGLEGTSLALDLAPVAEVRAMAGRVVELRLSAPMPNLLQVLAQPELALRTNRQGLGPMMMEDGGEGTVDLAMRSPSSRGLPEDEDWAQDFRPVALSSASAEDAIAGFFDGQSDLVTGGRLDFWPLADPGPLSRGALRIDPAIGLFGLQVVRTNGVLSTPEGRDALSLALDRDALIEPFGIAGWSPTARIVPPALYGDANVPERWTQFSLEERRSEAGRRIASLVSQLGEDAARVTIYLPAGPGNDRLFAELDAQWRPLGLDLVREERRASAEIVLVDRTARFAGPRWYLNQFHCDLDRGVCSPEADDMIAAAVRGRSELPMAQIMEQAEAQMLQEAIYIPIGAPIRWSLVRGGLDAFVPNAWAFHPLPPLAQIPN
ncbi:ABC transporter substrate-binding protein [Paraurantiacibacter namhicola]|uniref:Nickel-binding periplasmic protein n=1 Tax=Paraurantiacibacter namhicola TaxID=645517 RepID=A0A1C7D5J5_9SPHN|nr:ABC transporter substrate-binding protein [Paraurantiacibacter namhicola]ANU06573.1 Nickel-binding periplasmic protein precursor [Paraurantiacibacter namhicola]